MNILAFLFAIEIGIIPSNVIYGYENNQPEIFTKTGYYTTLEGGVLIYDILYIKGLVRTEMVKEINKTKFYPHLALYGLEAGMEYGILKIGIKHLCAHPIIPFAYKSLKQSNIDMGYNEIFIRIESP